MSSLGAGVVLNVPFDDAVQDVRAALAQHSFGVLTEIDVQALLPCNVTVRQTPDGVLVRAVDPQLMLGVAPQMELAGVASEASPRPSAALSKLRENATAA